MRTRFVLPLSGAALLLSACGAAPSEDTLAKAFNAEATADATMICFDAWGRVVPAGTPGSDCGSTAFERFAATGKSINGRIAAYWRAKGGLEVFGYPIEDPRVPPGEPPPEHPGLITQLFERDRLEVQTWFVNHQRVNGDVTAGRLGADWLLSPRKVGNTNAATPPEIFHATYQCDPSRAGCHYLPIVGPCEAYTVTYADTDSVYLVCAQQFLVQYRAHPSLGRPISMGLNLASTRAQCETSWYDKLHDPDPNARYQIAEACAVRLFDPYVAANVASIQYFENGSTRRYSDGHYEVSSHTWPNPQPEPLFFFKAYDQVGQRAWVGDEFIYLYPDLHYENWGTGCDPYQITPGHWQHLCDVNPELSFRDFFNTRGGLPRFGYPLTDVIELTNLTRAACERDWGDWWRDPQFHDRVVDGCKVLLTDPTLEPYDTSAPHPYQVQFVQYTERRRIEYHPAQSVPHRIQLGLLGSALKNSQP